MKFKKLFVAIATLGLLGTGFVALAACGGGGNSQNQSVTYAVTYEQSSDYEINGLKERYKAEEEVTFTVNVLNETKELSAVRFDGTKLKAQEDGSYKAIMPEYDAIIKVNLSDIKGQETAKRALEIAAAGGHHLLMVGPPGSGKSMLAARLPTLLPRMTQDEILEVSQIHSVAGLLNEGRLITQRPFRNPHHSASTPAMVGGGLKAKPGEISLAHRGVLFLDELPEFSRQTLEALRQPIETGVVSVARANMHVTYPARFQLVAAMNPCKCGYLGIAGHECSRAPRCAEEYQARISGPMLDRFDMQIEVPLIQPWELSQQKSGETSATVRHRVEQAIAFATERFRTYQIHNNAEASGQILEKIAPMTTDAEAFLVDAAQKMMLSGRGYHRMIRVARTIADLDQTEIIQTSHMAEALSFYRSARFRKD